MFSSDCGRDGGGGGGGAGVGGGHGIVEALPDKPDPAMLGGMRPVAQAALQVHGLRSEPLCEGLPGVGARVGRWCRGTRAHVNMRETRAQRRQPPNSRV